MKFTSLALAATLMFAATAQANESVIRKALTQQFPGAQIGSVTKTPYSGLFEVYLDGQLVYIDAKAQYVFAGDVIDLKNRANLTQARLNQLQAIKWDSLPLGNKLKVGGTPTLFFANGQRVPGMVPAAQLERLLAANAK